jgi:hypothetical protein
MGGRIKQGAKMINWYKKQIETNEAKIKAHANLGNDEEVKKLEADNRNYQRAICKAPTGVDKYLK